MQRSYEISLNEKYNPSLRTVPRPGPFRARYIPVHDHSLACIDKSLAEDEIFRRDTFENGQAINDPPYSNLPDQDSN